MHAAAHGQIESVLLREVHDGDDIADLLGLQDRQRLPVEHAVVDHARRVVAFVRGGDHSTAHQVTQSLDSLARQRTRRGDICHFVTPSAADDRADPERDPTPSVRRKTASSAWLK